MIKMVAYIMLGLKRNTVELKEYDSIWKDVIHIEY